MKIYLSNYGSTYFDISIQKHIALAFGELNSLFDSLLASPQLPTIFRIKIARYHAVPIPKIFEGWSTVKLEWIQALDTIGCVKRGYVIQFLRYHASRLINLRSVKICIRAKRAASNLSYLCEALSQLQSLQVFQLKCISGPVDKTLSDPLAKLFKIILQLPCLRRCTLDLWNLQETNFDQKTIADLPSNQSIKYLSINNVDRKILYNIVSCCHRLKSFIAQRDTREDIFVAASTYHPIQQFYFTDLSSLTLFMCNLTFNELELICATTTRHLRHLRLNYSVYVFTNHYEDYLDYFDQTRWTKLLQDIEVVHITIKINAWDDVAKDIISSMVKANSWFKWVKNENLPSYAVLNIKKPN